MQTAQPRDDYNEFLILTLIFLGILPTCGVKFRIPGAFHHARWMAKAIYSLKIYPFRNQFKMTTKELDALRDVCLFIVTTYVQAWCQAPFASKAAKHDLDFLKKIYHYRKIDSKISRVTLQKFKNHLWYLTPECAGMSFFDLELSLETKRKMVIAFNLDFESEECAKNFDFKLKDIDYLCTKDIDDFITSQSANFFQRFNIGTGFFALDPSLWSKNDGYIKGLGIVNHLTVINDVAERGVHLIEEYNEKLTKNERQKQFLMQIVEETRKKFPDTNKDTVIQGLSR